MKSKLERLNFKQDEVTIMSFDAVKLYPSIKYKLVEKLYDNSYTFCAGGEKVNISMHAWV
jgi:hypothetical protein